jgi:IclR family acetate operon transcriptional repressor
VDAPPRGTLGTVRNAVLLLDLLSEGAAHQPLTELADRSGMSVPTVHRLLRSLVHADLVEQEPTTSRYGLGRGLVRLSERYLARHPILKALSPYLSELRDATGATIHVALLVGDSVVYVDRVDGAQAGGLYREAHRVRDALCTASGRVLAAADDAAWATALDRLEGEERATAEGSRQRWAAADFLVAPGDGLGDAAEVAVPVKDAHDRPIAALAGTGQTNATDVSGLADSVAPHLIRAANAARRVLGHA